MERIQPEIVFDASQSKVGNLAYGLLGDVGHVFFDVTVIQILVIEYV